MSGSRKHHKQRSKARASRAPHVLLRPSVPLALVLLLGALAGCNQAHPEQNQMIALDLISRALTPTTTPAPTDTTPPTVSSVAPTDGAAAVATNTTITVTFSEAMDPSTVTANTTDSNCTLGSIQVSTSAAFGAGTCIRMAAAPASGGGNKSFTLTPNANLAATTVHYVRVVTTVADTAGNTLAAQFQQASGFTTGAGPDVTAPLVNSTTPANNATGISTGTTIAVDFNEAMNPSTITTNTADTTCSGTLRVSSNGFASCVQMNAAPVASGGNMTFTITPAAALSNLTTYQIRVTTGVQDAAGNALAATFTTATGFQTVAGTKRVFVTAALASGDIDANSNGNPMPEADAICMADGSYPGSGTFKAMLVDNVNRRACSTANCGGGPGEHIDWVFQASTPYVRASGGQAVMTTNANGIFVFGTLTNSFGAGSTKYWSGLNADWTTDTTNLCNDSGQPWDDSSGGVNHGTKGDEAATDGTAAGGAGTPPQCNNSTRTLLCVEQ